MAVLDPEAPAPAGWLTTSQAARRMEVSANWTRTLAERGTLRSVQTALGRLIDPQSVNELVRARAAGSRGPETAA